MARSTDFQSCWDVFQGRTSTRTSTKQRECVLLTNTTLPKVGSEPASC